MQAKGKTVFLTTHFMEEAERLCDRIAIMDHGKIIALGSPAELIKEHFKEKAIEFEAEQPPSEAVLKDLAGATQVDIDEEKVVLHSNNIPATMSALLKYAESGQASAQIKELRVREASLEDVFLKLTGRKIRD
jgi:ABC-2 type transport system ATP-binding protein